jgi:hypothetical protein
MFALEQPSMALNDTRVNNTVQMAINRLVQPIEGVSSILGAVVAAAKAQPGGKLKNLVINCHGLPGQLQLGVGIDRSLTNRFGMLVVDDKPIVEVIYLRSCLVARIDGPGSTTDGNLFCCEIAKSARATVVASTALQQTRYKKSLGMSIPYGMLDKFEGTTLVYGPGGNVLSSQVNPMLTFWNEAE